MKRKGKSPKEEEVESTGEHQNEQVPVPRALTHSVNISGGPPCVEFHYMSQKI